MSAHIRPVTNFTPDGVGASLRSKATSPCDRDEWRLVFELGRREVIPESTNNFFKVLCGHVTHLSAVL